MSHIRTLFILYLFFLSFICHGQQQAYERKDIAELANKAEKYFTELNFRESLRYSRESLKQAISINDNYLIAVSYNTIAGNYDELTEPDKSIMYYEKGLGYANKTTNDSLKSWLNNNLGNMYCFEKKQYEKGIEFYKTALGYSQKLADTSQIVFTQLNMAWAHFEFKKFDEGWVYLSFVNNNFDRYGSNHLIAARLLLNARYYGSKKQFERADRFFLESISKAIETNEKIDLSYSYKEYSEFLNANGNYKKAYHYLELYDKIKDEIYNNEKIRKAALEGVNLELDESKRAIERIEAENEIQALSIRKSQIIVVLFIVMLFVLSLLTYILYKNNVYRKKTNAELLKTNAELLVAKNKAEEAANLKTQFVSTISHELRTPLYGVVGITNMISDEHKELAQSPHLASLKFSAKYLLSLVNDILQINKIEEKRVVLENLSFTMGDELQTITDSLQFIATRNNNRLWLEIDPAIPEFLIGDKLRLSQIFMNLISNALKFTTNGEVHITAEQIKITGNMHHILFKVADNGIGIAKEDQDKIFEKFVQIERKENDYQGTGLGLSIVKRLIELFGSEIHLESEENVGTTFAFTIVLEHNPQKSVEIINNIEVDLTSSHIFNVLVVEDNKINQMVTRKILENNNFKVQVVDDGIAALAVLQKKKFDMILMDINMPIINGFETTRRIRASGNHTPVIALTAYDKGEITEEAISSGMNDIIIKPFEPVKLFQVILEQINKKMLTKLSMKVLSIMLLLVANVMVSQNIEIITKGDTLQKPKYKQFIYLCDETNMTSVTFVAKVKATGDLKNVESLFEGIRVASQKIGANLFKFESFTKQQDDKAELILGVYFSEDIFEDNFNFIPKDKIYIFGSQDLSKSNIQSYKFDGKKYEIGSGTYTEFDMGNGEIKINKGGFTGMDVWVSKQENGYSSYFSFSGIGLNGVNYVPNGGVGININTGKINKIEPNLALLLLRIFTPNK